MELEELIPKHKCDIESVERLKTVIEPSDIKEIVSELFKWLQDPNWPVALKLSDVLPHFGEIIVPEIKRVIDSGDDLWQYSIFYFIIPKLNKYQLNLIKENIVRLACEPTQYEKEVEMDKVAKEFLDLLFD